MTPEAVVEEDQEFRELTGHDRCDKCIAQAYFLAVYENGELAFCRHHFMEMQDLIEGSAKYVIDGSEHLS